MKRRNPDNVHEYENRHGKTVYYLRRPGQRKVRLRIPDGVLPWSPAFMEIYEAALSVAPATPTIGEGRTVLGTVNAAVVGYYQSTAFTKGLAKSTQDSRRAILENFRNDHGNKRIALMHSTALQNILCAKAPNVARNWKKALRGFIDHCLSQGMIRIDPLAGVKLPKARKSGGFHTWTEDEITQYRDRHAPGTKARLALELLLQTGHARSDVVRMGRQHVKSGKLSMRRQKTDVQFDIPMLPDLVSELQRHPKADLSYLTTEYGKPFTAAGFGNWFRDRCNEAGLFHCTAHGLRKAAAVRQALIGATAPELMAWFGWKTIGEAQRYIEEANRIKLAESAGAKIISGTNIGSPSDPVSQINPQTIDVIEVKK
jgi:integrase